MEYLSNERENFQLEYEIDRSPRARAARSPSNWTSHLRAFRGGLRGHDASGTSLSDTGPPLNRQRVPMLGQSYGFQRSPAPTCALLGKTNAALFNVIAIFYRTLGMRPALMACPNDLASLWVQVNSPTGQIRSGGGCNGATPPVTKGGRSHKPNGL
jgi:hypothetical protein